MTSTSSRTSASSRPSSRPIPRTPIDPRGPRFGAAITAVLLIVAVGLALIGGTPAALTERLVQPAFLLFVFIVLVFAWGASAGVGRHPYGWLYRRFVRPRLAAPVELENPAPPTFAQGIGLVVTAVGLLLFLAGVPYALVVTGSLAFIAAFLNSVFDYCVGCQIYLLLVRTGVLGRRSTPVAP